MRDSPVMADKPKFFLAPSRLGRPAGTDDSQTAKPKFTGLTTKQSKLQFYVICVFTGLKESKLGVLAESKLSSSAASVTSSNFGVNSSEKADTKAAPVTFQFTPLTKPSDDEDNKSKTGDVENKNPNEKKEFVFGQNLTERVENVETKPESDTKVEDTEVPAEDAKDPPSSESTKDDLLFSTSVSPKGEEDSGKANSKTLSEAAAEYTETHSNKRKYDVVDVVTGEEEESNVLKANVKLYIFDSEKKNWVERGRGGIRLNDDPSSTPGHLRWG